MLPSERFKLIEAIKAGKASVNGLFHVKQSKFHSQAVKVDGIRFHSIAESKRYQLLKEREKIGEIKKLELQPKYDIIINGKKVTRYIADFRYVDCRTNAEIVEDVKGFKTKEYIIKKNLMDAVFNIKILET